MITKQETRNNIKNEILSNLSLIQNQIQLLRNIVEEQDSLSNLRKANESLNSTLKKLVRMRRHRYWK